MELRYTPVVDLPGVEAFRALGFCALKLGFAQLGFNRADHRRRDFILNLEDICELPIVALGP